MRAELALTSPVALQGNLNQSSINTDALTGCPAAYRKEEVISHACEDKFDNYFVMHAIPRTENQYSWISASYQGNCSGTINVGYQPYDTWEYGTNKNGVNPYDLVTEGSENVTLGFSSQNNKYDLSNNTITVLSSSKLAGIKTAVSGGRQLNALLNNYNGPYQAPTFVFRNALE